MNVLRPTPEEHAMTSKDVLRWVEVAGADTELMEGLLANPGVVDLLLAVPKNKEGVSKESPLRVALRHVAREAASERAYLSVPSMRVAAETAKFNLPRLRDRLAEIEEMDSARAEWLKRMDERNKARKKARKTLWAPSRPRAHSPQAREALRCLALGVRDPARDERIKALAADLDALPATERVRLLVRGRQAKELLERHDARNPDVARTQLREDWTLLRNERRLERDRELANVRAKARARRQQRERRRAMPPGWTSEGKLPS